MGVWDGDSGEEDDRPRSRSWLDGRVLTCNGYDDSIRWRPGERLEHLFEQRCDWLRRQGQAGHLVVDAAGGSLSYTELDARANQLARFLIRQGVQPGDRIGLLSDVAVDGYRRHAGGAQGPRRLCSAGRELPCGPGGLHRLRRPGPADTDPLAHRGQARAADRPGRAGVRGPARGPDRRRTPRPVHRGRGAAAARRACLHHLHVRLDAQAQGCGRRPREHLQLHPGSRRSLRDHPRRPGVPGR